MRVSSMWIAVAAACAMPGVAAAADGSPVTFTRDIAPIFQEKCE